MNQNQLNQTNEKNQPVKKFRAGAICATVWSNTGVSKDGKSVEFKSITFDRVYKDKAGEWKKTSTLKTQDLPKATAVLSKAYEYLVLSNDFSENFEEMA